MITSTQTSKKDTMTYIRENFKWTEEADEWLRTKICKWTTTKGKEQKT